MKLRCKNLWMKRKHKTQLIFDLMMNDVIFPRKGKYKKRSNMDKTGISLEVSFLSFKTFVLFFSVQRLITMMSDTYAPMK